MDPDLQVYTTYLEAHNVQAAVAEVVAKVLKERPADPIAFIGKMLCARAHSASKTLVLVRSHNPMPGMLARMKEWSDSLARAGMLCMHVSMDATHGLDASEKVLELGLPKACMHTFTEAALLETFPHLAPMQKRMVGEDDWEGFRCKALAEGMDLATIREQADATKTWHVWSGEKHSIAWGFHMEAITLWWRQLGADGWASCGGAKPMYVWILEDDVGYTSALSHLLEAYAASTADLITDEPAPSTPTHSVAVMVASAIAGREADQVETNPVSWEGWCWHETCTDAFVALVPGEKRVKTKEHAQRFSSRFLDAIADQVESGCSSWSEMYAPSLCAVLPGFVTEPLKPSSMPSSPDTMYNCTGRVSANDYAALCADPKTHGLLLHALKF